MKTIIIIFFVLISFCASSQGKSFDTARVDTAQLFFAEVGNNLTIKDFQQWLYKSPVSPAKYDEFVQLYNAYMQEQYAAWLKRKKK